MLRFHLYDIGPVNLEFLLLKFKNYQNLVGSTSTIENLYFNSFLEGFLNIIIRFEFESLERFSSSTFSLILFLISNMNRSGYF